MNTGFISGQMKVSLWNPYTFILPKALLLPIPLKYGV
nr:MAG TPA: PHD finger protein 12 MRG binding domain [Caudoviricetes sp.]